MVFSMFDLTELHERLSAYRPITLSVTGRRQAAVAMVLRDRLGELEVLFIERARRQGDPWSGHMAFPGGRMEAGDSGSRDTAERETLEEVGVGLDTAIYLGRLDDLKGRPESSSGDLVISAHVYHLDLHAPMLLSSEVEEAFWFPLSGLHEREREVEHPWSEKAGMEMPGVLVGTPDRHIVWGLTYRFLEVFFTAVGRPLRERWSG
jgi:8-oxo-dGTP pyrophosphatase MutT (NUDIX family)